VLEASLKRDLGQVETAARQLEQAIRLYEQVGETQLVARVLVKLGNLVGGVEPGRGVEVLRQALELLADGSAPRLELCARHHLIWHLAAGGQPREALTLLEEARPLYRELGDPWIQMRLRWLEGLLAQKLGALGDAETIFERLWQDLRARESRHSLTLLSIDLAATYVEGGKLDAALELLSRVYALLAEWGMHSEGLGIWMLMQKALVKRTAKATVFREAARYFHQAWNAPLHFKEPGA